MKSAEADVHMNKILALVTFNAAIGGFLFGYDTSSISASLLQIGRPSTSLTCPGLTQHWLGSFTLECITSFTVLGAFISSLCAGRVNDALGRRQVLVASCLTFSSGSVLMAISWSVPSMLVARVIAGVGVGLFSSTMPLYVSECCPASIRGMIVLTFNIMIVLGQTSAAGYSAIMFYAETPNGWRWILGVGAIPGVLMYCGLLYVPESPRWLLSRGRLSDAKAAFDMLRDGFQESGVEEEFQAMVDGVNEELSRAPVTPADESTLTTLTKRYWNDVGVRRALCLGCFLQGLQQLIGINTIMYYGASVLVMASSTVTDRETCFSDSNKTSVALNIVLSAGQALGVMTSFVLIEHVGRRPLIMTSLAGAIVGLCGVGTTFAVYYVDEGMVVVFVLIYVFMFGIGIAGIPWVVNAEIYPIHVRAQCTSFATAINWLMNFLVSATFLTLAQTLSTDRTDPQNHPDGVFYLYALIAVVGFVVIYFTMPETKGLTLEETSRLFVHDEEQRLATSEVKHCL